MTDKKTQTDYWNKGVEFARAENWEKAIECYENAVEIKPNPALYTNLASCYNNLGNKEKERENYLLAIPGLLNREYVNTSGPANSTAWYLFENDTELEKAEKIAKIATEISSDSAASRDTYARILLKNEKKDKAIREMAVLRNNFPDFEPSAELYKEYDKEINNYISEFFKEKSKKDIAGDLLGEKGFPVDIIKYIIDGDKNKYQKVFYPYSLNTLYKEFRENFISDDDEIMKRFFRVMFSMDDSYYKEEVFNSITGYRRNIENYNRALKILRGAKINISSIFTVIVSSDYSSEKNPDISVFFEENFKDDKDIESVFTEVKKYSKNNNSRVVNTMLELLLDRDYDKYIERILKIMSETDSYYDISSFVNMIKNNEKKIYFIVSKMENYNNAKNKFDSEFFDGIKLLLEKDEVSDNFTELCKKVENSQNYGGFYNYFIKNINKDDNFYGKMLRLSYLIDGKNTFNNMMNYDTYDFDENRMVVLKNIGFNYEKQLKAYLDKYSDTYVYNKETWRKYLKQIVESDFENVIENLDKISKDKKKLSFLIPVIWEVDSDKFYPHLLKLASLNSKQVKEAVIECLKGYENGFEDFKKMLKSKKQAERIVGVELLASLNKPDVVVPLLNELLLKEKAQKVKDAVNKYFSVIKQNEAENRRETVLKFGIEEFNREAEQNKDLNLEKIKNHTWINLEKLPELYLKTGEKLSKSLQYSLFSSLFKSESTELYYEAEKLLEFIKEDELSEFSEALYRMNKKNSEPFVWILLNKYYKKDDIVEELYNLLLESIENNNQTLIKLLTKNILVLGGKKGFRKIAELLNKTADYSIQNIYYSVGADLNIPREHLDDLMLNNFGFDENGNKEIDYGTRKFILTLTPDFKFTVVGDNEKSYKNLPKPSKKDNHDIADRAYEDFKDMKKELRDFVKDMKRKLESEMVKDIKRDADDWGFLFMKNPIMNNLAKGLIWSADGKTFRVMEDNTFADIEDEEFELPGNAVVSLVHPIDLSDEDIDAWNEQLEDYEITQPFEQLNRIVFTPTDEQLDDHVIDEFKGYMVMRISFKSKLMDKFGWNRGPAEDAGCYYSYEKYIGSIKAELNFMGECYGGYGDRFQEIWMGELYFYGLNGKEIKLKDIPKRQLSEIYLQAKSLADSGSGYNENYMDTEW